MCLVGEGTSGMGNSSALCLRFDLDTFSSRHAYTDDVGWGAYAYLPRLLRLAQVGGARYQFCACGQGLREYPLEIEAIRAEGHAIDSHLYSHRVTLLDELARVVEELLLTELSFRDQRVPWTGLGATGMYANGIDACGEVQGLLVERGYQWCSTRYVKDSDIADMQPYWLDEHLLEIPCVGMSDRNYFYDRQAPPSGLIGILVRYLQESVAKDLVYAIFLHPGVLARFDPDCDVVAALVERAGEFGVPLVTMDQICQWRTARREVERFEAGQRPFGPACWQDCPEIGKAPLGPLTLQRWLEADRYWIENYHTPASQPEKVMDYVGGWRLYPNSTRNGVTINRFGLRGPDTLRRVQLDRRRILCIGDSCVFGTIPDDAPWPAQLQTLLDAWAPLRYEVLNAGINGQKSVHVAHRLPQLVRGLKPQLVLIAILANDLWQTEGRAEIDWGTFCPATFIRHVQAAIDICRGAGASAAVLTPPGLVPADHKMTPFMLSGYHQATALGNRKQPEKMRWLYDCYNDALRKLASDNDLMCVDTARRFDEQLDTVRGRLFVDTCHMVKEGNAEMARTIAEYIQDLDPAP